MNYARISGEVTITGKFGGNRCEGGNRSCAQEPDAETWNYLHEEDLQCVKSAAPSHVHPRQGLSRGEGKALGNATRPSKGKLLCGF